MHISLNTCRPNYDFASHEGWHWRLNGKDADEGVNDDLNEISSFEIIRTPCEFCGTMMAFSEFTDSANENNDQDVGFRRYSLAACPRCANWMFDGHESTTRCMDSPNAFLASSIIKRFNSDIPAICAAELAQYLRRHPSAWHTMTPTSFELLIANIWKANYAQSEVRHVGRPGDMGIDVLVIHSAHNTQLIQAKRREDPNKAEAFSTIQSILGTMVLTGNRHGIVVTTANRFSHQAHQASQCASTVGYTVELVDKGMLDRMLGTLFPSHPWLEALSQCHLNGMDAEAKTQLLANMPDYQQGLLF